MILIFNKEQSIEIINKIHLLEHISYLIFLLVENNLWSIHPTPQLMIGEVQRLAGI